MKRNKKRMLLIGIFFFIGIFYSPPSRYLLVCVTCFGNGERKLEGSDWGAC